MRKMLFIYNAQAGKGRVRSRLAGLLETLSGADWLVTIYSTRGPGDATLAAAQLGGEFDRVVCCGGDGTLHEVINGLMTLEERPVLGYIPAGTTNDFARNLNLPKGYTARAATAAAGVPRPCDIGYFNGEYFVYVAAFGAFTSVAYDTPQPFKNRFGHLAYLLSGVAQLASLKSYSITVEYDGGREEGEYLFGMMSNTVSVGGLIDLPSDSVALDDGLLELLLVRTPKNAVELQHLIGALMQQNPEVSDSIQVFHTAKLKLTGDRPISWTLDGEYGGNHQETEISACHRAVEIVRGA